MAASAIIKPFDVIKDIRSGLPSVFILLPMNLFDLQGAEEALHGGVVVAVPRAAHADLHAIVSQLELVSSAGVLAAAIGMVQQPG